MATDDSGQNNQSGDPGTGGAPTPEPEKPEDRANRMNAAKAFYRAMYAGEDVVPDDFGMSDQRGPERGGNTGPCPNCARLEAQAAEFEKQKNEAENFYKRIAADFENYRRRLDREREEFLGLGIQKAIEQILPALDDMDRARSSLQTVTDPKAILDSLNLVFARFTKCLEAVGVKQMEVIGEPFDPRLHEPVQEIETNEFPDGAVVHELRRGYVYKDKVLRPTLVNVASNPSGVVVPKAAPPAADPNPSEGATAPAAPATEAVSVAANVEPAVVVVVEPAVVVETVPPGDQASPSVNEPPAPIVDSALTPPAAAVVPEQAAPADAEPTSEKKVQPPPSVNEAPAPIADSTPTLPAAAVVPEQAAPADAEPTSEKKVQPPSKKAIDKLKPTRVNTETQDLPIFKIDDYEKLAPEAGSESEKGSTGTIYDITDVDIEDKPIEFAETTGKQVLDE